MPTAITSTLEPFPTRIVTSCLANLRLIRSPCFELQILATEPVLKYPGATASISKVYINNMYITYTFVDLAILLIRQILGAVPLPVTSLLAVEGLSLRLRSRLGFLLLSSNLLAVLLEVPLLLPFALFLETSGLVDHLHLMLLLDFYLRSFQHREELGNSLVHPLHIIVHHEALVAWWQ